MKARFCFIMLLACSCSAPGTTDHATQSNDSVSSSPSSVEVTSPVAVPAELKGVYVGIANPLNETGEFSLALYYVDSVNSLEGNQFDSIVYQDDALSRKYVPMAVARSNFNMVGLDSVSLYSKQHAYFGTYALKRVEYIETMIESEFGAVYNGSEALKNMDESFYAISSSANGQLIKDFKTVPFDDHARTLFITSKLGLAESDGWVAYHYKILPAGLIYTTLTSDRESYMIDGTGETPRTMAHVQNDYSYGKLIPIPLQVNGRPVLLVNYFVPESDVAGTYLAVFDGAVYKPVSAL